MGFLTQIRWSPYIVGAGIGMLSWFAFFLSTRPIGCSTAYVKISGALERMARGDRIHRRPYLRQVAPNIDWGVMLSAIMVGSIGIHTMYSLRLVTLVRSGDR